MSHIGKPELLFYVIIYCIFIVGMYIYTSKLDTPSLDEFPPEIRVIILGFYNALSTSYKKFANCYVMANYYIPFFVLCLLINVLNVHRKKQVAEVIAIAMVTHLYGMVFVGITLAIVIVSAMVGCLLRGSKFLPPLVGMLALGIISEILDEYPDLLINKELGRLSFAYSGFFAHLVRGIQICCDYARETGPVGWRRLFSECLGFVAFPHVYTHASFVLFTDWLSWRNDKDQYEWKAPFRLTHLTKLGKATVVRTLSVRNLILRTLRLAFWCLVHKYIICELNPVNPLPPIVNRIYHNRAETMDWFVLCFAANMMLIRFNVYYVLFYQLSRLVGDITQFLLSPAFSPDSGQIVKAEEGALEAWKKASWLKKWCLVEIEMECLMPEGPCCVIVALTSSEIWRKFDIGLYNVLKHYIYVPWMRVAAGLFVKDKEELDLRKNTLANNLVVIFGSALTFLFVLTFHGWDKAVGLWASISFVLWVTERSVRQANRKFGISNALATWLSPAWEERIRCVALSIIQIFNVISFLCFVTSFDCAIFLFRLLFTQHGPSLLAFAIPYCSFQIKLALDE